MELFRFGLIDPLLLAVICRISVNDNVEVMLRNGGIVTSSAYWCEFVTSSSLNRNPKRLPNRSDVDCGCGLCATVVFSRIASSYSGDEL